MKVKCKDCGMEVEIHKWNKIKAQGWFFGRDGTDYCPECLPEWVIEWRKLQTN